MVRGLPFLTTFTLICSSTLMKSRFGVRWYNDHRYSSMQTSETRHSSAEPIGFTVSLSGGIRSDVSSAAIRNGRLSGGSIAGSVAEWFDPAIGIGAAVISL